MKEPTLVKNLNPSIFNPQCCNKANCMNFETKVWDGKVCGYCKRNCDACRRILNQGKFTLCKICGAIIRTGEARKSNSHRHKKERSHRRGESSKAKNIAQIVSKEVINLKEQQDILKI